MPTLDLYKERKTTSVKLKDRVFLIPNEYTVEEAERLLELQQKREAIESEKVDEAKKGEQMKAFWGVVFDQLEVIFQHHQPEVTADEIRSLVSHREALDILGFFDKYRHLSSENPGESKKKTLAAKQA